MSIFDHANQLLFRCASKALAGVALAAATLLPATQATPAQALVGAPFEGRYTMSAEHVCPANRVVYEMEFHVTDAGLADLQTRFPLHTIAFRLENMLPDGLKWESFTIGGDFLNVDTNSISSVVRDNDRLVIGGFQIISGDHDGDGVTNTVKVRGVAEVLPGVPLPRTFSHTAKASVVTFPGGPLAMLLAQGFHSVSPGNEDGTVNVDDSFPTEVTVENDCAGIPPVPPLEGDACLSADYDVFCGPVPGTYNVQLSGATVAEDFVAISVLTPGVLIDNGGILTDTVAIPVIAGTYFADLVITGAAPGSLVTFTVSGDGDVGVLEELPGGFAVCCTTQVIVAIPEVCEEAPAGPIAPADLPEGIAPEEAEEPEEPADEPDAPGEDPAPETDLGIRKSGPEECLAGETCTFQIEVSNESSETYEGEIVVSDVPSDPRVRYLSHSPSAWQCEAGPAAVICRVPNARLAPGASTALTLRMSIPDSRALAQSDFENCGYLGGETGAGANARPDTAGVQQALTDLGFNPGPVDGQFGRRTAGALRDFQRANGLNVTGTATEETLEALGLTGETDEEPFRDAFADDNAFCIPVDVTRPRQSTPTPPPPAPEQTAPTCPRGQVYRNGRCRDVVRTCPRGQILRNGRCVTVEINCPRGTRLQNGRCVPIVVQCPSGTRRVNGRCVPIVVQCPSGTQRINGRCVPIEIKCPQGTRLIRGKCRPINDNNQGGQTTQPPQQSAPQQTRPQTQRCKQGQVLINGRCVSLQLQIPGGTIRIQ